MNPVTQYWVKTTFAAVAFLVWLGSVTVLPGAAGPLFVLTPTVQAALFGAAAVAFGWSVVQGSSAVRALTIERGQE